MAATTSTREVARAFVDSFNTDYEKVHRNFEEQFWGTKMALTGDYSSDKLASTKKAMEDLLSDPEKLKTALELRQSLGNTEDPTDSLVKTLDIIIKTCQANDMSGSPDAKKIREKTSALESTLEMKRNSMKLGYTVNDAFTEASSVGLRNLMRTASDEATRKAAYDGLRSIGPFVCEHGFVEIVKLRNKMAKQLGFVDYYDYKVSNAEGFSKSKLFEILDGLEQSTRPLMIVARRHLEHKYGPEALDPWNTAYMMAGDVIKKMDPYFPFAKAVERYIRSYAALKISYAGATMNLDLLDRQRKYSNGFCHWPQPAWIKSDNTWTPSVANFTSLADPTAVGSGKTALITLMHEAGHAAHFASIRQPSPLFSQERAPTSVAYAENQSMFLDSLVGDAAWMAKYARDSEGNPIPFDLIREEIEATHPFQVFQLRAMLAVSYFEKALYELPEERVTAEEIQKLADEIEQEIQGGFSARPLLSVPHIVSDEASCYYQGYTLAEMSVHQTRAFFKKRDGFIVDNPNVGPTLTESYWKCGNSRPFLDLVKELTGHELSGDAWTDVLKESVEEKIASEKKEYDESIAASKTCSEDDSLDLDMTIRFVDGDTLISDSSKADGGLLGACREFEAFVKARVDAAATASS